MRLKNKKGQNTMEYALLIAAVVAGLVMMQRFVARSVAGKAKASVDDLGEQFDPTGYTANYNTTSHSARQETVQDKVTTSTLTDQEYTNRTGSENVTAWNGNNLFN